MTDNPHELVSKTIWNDFEQIRKVYGSDAYPEFYYKCLLYLAFRFVKCGDSKSAQSMVGLISKPFIETVLPQILQEDPMFVNILMEVCCFFDNNNLIKPQILNLDFRPTQAAAKA